MVEQLGESNVSALLEDFHAQHPILLGRLNVNT